MNMSVSLSPLSRLAECLEADLQQRLGGEVVQVRCATRQSVLMVLVDHAACAIADPTEAIAQITAAIQATEPALLRQAQATSESGAGGDLGDLETQPTVTFATQMTVQLYLRLEGQSRPYQTQRYTWTESELETPDSLAELDDFAIQPLTATDDNAADLDSAEVNETEMDGAIAALTQPAAIDPADPLLADDLAGDWSLWGSLQINRWMAIAVGSVVSIAAFSGALYALTRPCVLGRCPELAQAEELSQTALARLADNPTVPTVQTVHTEIQQADHILRSIPPWSAYHRSAVTLRQSYQTQATELDQVMTAQVAATAAVAASQDPPHPISQWQTAREHWQTAIALLTDISPESDLDSFIQQKQAEYAAHLATVERRIRAEESASQSLDAATKAAQQAESQQLTADSVTTWQQTVDRWRDAVNALQRIPQGTLAHTEAIALLNLYQANLSQAQQQATQENIAQQAYTQATTAAASARQFEQQTQWTLAVAAWRDALLNMRQVPTASIYGENVSSLVATYQDSLVRAESQLELAVARQQTQVDLNQTCAGTPLICTHTIAGGLIQVHLTAAYDRSVEQAMTNATARQDVATQGQIAEHVNTLLRALVTVGNNAGMPIELFDSKGLSLGRHDPRTTAYAPQ